MSGPTNRHGVPPIVTRAAMARRGVPTPGSTTARWTVPAGKNGAVWRSTNAAVITSWAGTSCVTSTARTPGATASMAPFMAAT